MTQLPADIVGLIMKFIGDKEEEICMNAEEELDYYLYEQIEMVSRSQDENTWNFEQFWKHNGDIKNSLMNLKWN